MRETKTLVATYDSIKAFSRQSSTNWLSISEFIDNSISSFLGTNNNDGSLEGLLISITYDISERNNKKLIIEDNAKGMEPNVLLDAMQPYNHSKAGREYNQYGIGMKFGCFYNGQDAYIYSKTLNTSEHYVKFTTSDKNDGQEVVLTVEESFENKIPHDSGTLIIIENLYSNRSKVNDNELDEILEALSWRYGKLILDKHLKIVLKKINNSDPNFVKYEKEVKGFVQKSFRFDDFINKYADDSEDKDNLIKNCKERIINLKKENQNNELLNIFCDKYLNNEKIELDLLINVNNLDLDDINQIRLNKNYYIPKDENDLNDNLNKKYNVILKIGILEYLKNEYSKYTGVTTYHKSRAINHGPNNRKVASESKSIYFKDIKIGSGGSSPTWRRLWGEIDLTGIEEPDINKAKFVWSENGYEDLTNALSEIYKDLSPLLQAMLELEKRNIKNNVSNNEEFGKVRKIQKDEKVLNQDLFDFKEQNDWLEYEIKNSNKKIKIYEKKLGEDANFININNNEQDCTSAIVNIDVAIWKPFIYEKDEDINIKFRANTVYKLVLALVLANDIDLLKHVVESNPNVSGISLESFQENKYELIKVISEVLEYISHKGN